MTTLYIARHGETEWNLQKRFQGQKNSPLTPHGIEQAHWLAEYLRDTNIDAIYTSSCERAVITATILKNNRNVPFNICDDLRETNMGAWEGMPTEEIKKVYPEEYEHFFFHPELYTPQGGETLDECKARLSKKLAQIVTENQNKTVLIVVHGIVLRILHAYFMHLSYSEVWNFLAKPTSLSLVEADGKNYDIKFWAKTEHYK